MLLDDLAYLTFLDQLKRTIGSDNRLYLLDYKCRSWWSLTPRQIRLLLLQTFTHSADRLAAANIVLKKCCRKLTLTDLSRLLQLISLPKDRLKLLVKHVHLVAPCVQHLALLCLANNFYGDRDRREAMEILSFHFGWEEQTETDSQPSEDQDEVDHANDEWLPPVRIPLARSTSGTVFDLAIVQRSGSLSDVVRASRADMEKEIRRRQASPQVCTYVPSCVGAIIDNLNPNTRRIFRRHSICE